MKSIIAAALWLCLTAGAQAAPLIEYHMHMPVLAGHKRVALTLDACTGKVDERILGALLDQKIKATIFVTGRWLKRNPQAIAVMKAHPDLFEIGNHGAMHLAAVDEARLIFNAPAAGSAAGVEAEVAGGAQAAAAAFGAKPAWFRGATANYTKSSMELIQALHVKIAGFSFSGDAGASYSTSRAASAMAAAKDGDIILAHINHPEKPAGAGVVQGLAELQAAGFTFVTLSEGFNTHPADHHLTRGR